jgi:hypothetical protein
VRLNVIGRIDELKLFHNDFSPTSFRWKNVTFHCMPVQDVDYENLNDSNLLLFLEFVISRHYRQG